ncbi:hypothetical protein PILCRDRAFT_218441 [Piloderma croceum F 1598]|uniref:Zinc-hook domain-containing protein n=1 Tax=Piloderma croceum (strain F 1598) TaxID=765440 RepID=A0A0C3GBY3_PILCF|nr:hypothetical protein PILCRDRAFT_218441 [Piloderma croceum F 1598]
MKGYDHTPLEREKVIEFISRLSDLQKRQRAEFEKIQSDSRVHSEEYNEKSRRLHTELESLKMQKNNMRAHISDTQKKITTTEEKLDATETLSGELHTLIGDIDEKKARLEKVKSSMESSNYEEKLAEKISKGRNLEDRRDKLNTELRRLGLQADARAKLDLKRAEFRTKTADVKNTLEAVNEKFRKLVGSDASADNMEWEVDRLLSDSDQRHLDAESEATTANKDLQQAETTLSNLKAQLKDKRDELKVLEKKLKDADADDLDQLIKEATLELSVRKELSGNLSGASQIYEKLLDVGKAKKVCTVCDRHLNDREMVVFEKFLRGEMKRSSPESIAENTEEMKEWEDELERLQKLVPIQASRDRLKRNELPALERQIKEQEAAIPAISHKAEEASDKMDELKKLLKDVTSMKQHAINIARTQKETDRLRDEISSLESELKSTGSTKTADEVEAELDALAVDLYALPCNLPSFR